MSQSKSVLDGVKSNASQVFPSLREALQGANPHGPDGRKLAVVSSCRTCGAPIYGPAEATAEEFQVGVKLHYTCECPPRKSLADTMHTK